MKSKPILAIAIAAALCTGCVGTGPNTQNGAVAGGAMGALAGAILGNNSVGHNSVGGAALGAVAGAIVAVVVSFSMPGRYVHRRSFR